MQIYAKLKGGALIVLDFEKAFDSLEWVFGSKDFEMGQSSL